MSQYPGQSHYGPPQGYNARPPYPATPQAGYPQVPAAPGIPPQSGYYGAYPQQQGYGYQQAYPGYPPTGYPQQQIPYHQMNQGYPPQAMGSYPPNASIPPPPGTMNTMPPPQLQLNGSSNSLSSGNIPPSFADSSSSEPMAIDTDTDLNTLVFLSQIPTTVSNELIEEILKVCGPVKSWKPLVDGNDKLFGSGFCVFEHPRGALRALKLLGGQLDIDTFVQPAEVEEGEEQAPGALGIFIVKADVDTWKFLKSSVPSAFEKPEDGKEAKVDEEESGAQKKLEDLLKEVKESRTKQFLSSFFMDTNGETETFARRESDDEDEAEHVKRLERREQDKLASFHERERRFENTEQMRLRRVAHDEHMDKEHEDRRANLRVTMAKKLVEYDDDIEKEKEDFYKDRERWWIRRQHERQREIDFDERDRRAEKDELVFAREHEDESAARAKAKSTTGFVVSRIMTKEERIAAIQDLISRIPEEKEGLWEWSIKWQFLEDTIVNGKIKPFLEKKMVEVLGQVETELLDFLLEKIRAQATAEEITAELTPLMDQEAEIFVMKLWRMVIYETEARSEGL